MNKEIWKDIPDYNGKYQVSTFGRIRRLYCVRKGKYYKLDNPVIVNQFLNKSKNSKSKAVPYKKVHICYNGKVTSEYVHILIAKTFIPNPNNLPEVNHIDKNTFNNNINNLEWCTLCYNRRYSSSKKVGCYDMDGNLVKIYDAIIDVKKDGFNYNSVRQCCLGTYNYKTHPKGLYVWKFID